MEQPQTSVVTGAFGYLGRHIAKRLLESGQRVVTLTSTPAPTPEQAAAIPRHPLCFDQPDRLAEAMRGASVLYNTYWIRYPMGKMTFERAVENSRTLLAAARLAGVSRVVHISITNPSEHSRYGYFRGKALVERALAESGLSHAILRPAVLFGDGGILIHNIAWSLRRLPVFGVFGRGTYRIQPIYVGDLAELAIQAAGRDDNVIVDAIGPETYTYRHLVEEVAQAIGVRPLIVSLPPSLALATASMLGCVQGDKIVTGEEVDAMMEDLLCTNSPPAGQTRLSQWLREHADELGQRYMSETARRRLE